MMGPIGLYHCSPNSSESTSTLKSVNLVGPGVNASVKVEQKNGTLEGKYVERDIPSGAITTTGSFKNGKPEGVWTIKQLTGRPLTIQNMKNGLRNGEFSKYYLSTNTPLSITHSGPDGIKQISFWSNGMPKGRSRGYYPNGQQIFDVSVDAIGSPALYAISIRDDFKYWEQNEEPLNDRREAKKRILNLLNGDMEYLRSFDKSFEKMFSLVQSCR